MKQDRCSKFFPKKCRHKTTIDEYGYPLYRRRDDGLFVLKNGHKLRNGNVVPYSHFLLMRYQAHVNTKYCNKSNSIKYLVKYVNKGLDRATCEAVLRIYGFDIHHRWPAV